MQRLQKNKQRNRRAGSRTATTKRSSDNEAPKESEPTNRYQQRVRLVMSADLTPATPVDLTPASFGLTKSIWRWLADTYEIKHVDAVGTRQVP